MNNGLITLCVVLGVMILLLAGVRLAIWFQAFRKELRYINSEISRTTGRERAHWERRKKRLLLSLIPFVGY